MSKQGGRKNHDNQKMLMAAQMTRSLCKGPKTEDSQARERDDCICSQTFTDGKKIGRLSKLSGTQKNTYTTKKKGGGEQAPSHAG